jgi:hypothetical protein|tara:strand:- start:2984 stop:3184 length:201 start_codon:yes stop_codon:yes gene_type:complete
MQVLTWFKRNDDDVIIKTAKSKGPGNPYLSITVADVRKGKITDSNGYENEVVLFVRANKVERNGRK